MRTIARPPTLTAAQAVHALPRVEAGTLFCLVTRPAGEEGEVITWFGTRGSAAAYAQAEGIDDFSVLPCRLAGYPAPRPPARGSEGSSI